jgi:hypothetical protein
MFVGYHLEFVIFIVPFGLLSRGTISDREKTIVLCATTV